MPSGTAPAAPEDRPTALPPKAATPVPAVPTPHSRTGRPAAVPPRRLGLGAPVVQRVAAGPKTPSGSPPVPRSQDPGATSARVPGTPGPANVPAMPTGDTPTVQRSTPTGHAPVVQRAAASVTSPRPLAAAVGGPQSQGAASSGTVTGGAPVVQRRTADGSAAPAGGLPVAIPGPAAHATPVVRHSAAAGTPAVPPPGGLPTPTNTPVARPTVQRAAPALPTHRTTATRHGDAPVPVQRTSTANPMNPMNPAHPAHPALNATGSTPAPTNTSAGTPTPRAVPLTTTHAAPPIALPVQRSSAASPEPPAPAPAPAPQVQRDINSTSPPPYSASPPPPPPPPPSGPPPAYSANEPPASHSADEEALPAYTPVDFNPRALTPGQIDELTHKMAGPIVRLLRTELRLERERTGRLRDPRR
ncbi:hypothetical protein [Streptomyces avermitilis]|uniref:hypothetical protein n=1 Tax=Streptomyces avermitilis TaxID=33903 RepID=UPI0033B24B02